MWHCVHKHIERSQASNSRLHVGCEEVWFGTQKASQVLSCGLHVGVCVGHLVEADELVMPKQGSYAQPATMMTVDRPTGQNDVGIVAWLLTMKTPECPQGRQV